MTERTLGSRWAFQGRALQVEVLDIEADGGRRSVREIVRHPGAAVVLAERPDGCFVFVRQFRKALERDLLEVVAGTLESGEDPDECARRELREETGYEARGMQKMGVIVPAPGYSDERLHVYHAFVSPTPGAHEPDEDEQIEVVLLSSADVERRIAEGELSDAKSLAAWLLHSRMLRHD